jgi:hypothetical protein
MNSMNKEGVPRQRTSRGEGGGEREGDRVARATTLEEGAVSRECTPNKSGAQS